MSIFNWIKQNKLTALLVFVIAFLLYRQFLSAVSFSRTGKSIDSRNVPVPGIADTTGFVNEMALSPDSDSLSASDIKDRMIKEESSMSVVVDNVREKTNEAVKKAESFGGYMVQSTLTQPEESPYAYLVLRVPALNLTDMLEFLRANASKVTSENLIGTDITDRYFDIETRLKMLEETKARFEQIMQEAQTVEQILKVQKEIISLQTQIESLKGQKQYLEKTAQNAKLTIHLSTDEWSLPYAPEDSSFRPKVIFKTAVRSLVALLRNAGSAIIWIAVYGLIWMPLTLVFIFIRKRMQSKKPLT